MATEKTPATTPQPLHMTLTTDGQRATLVLSGALETRAVRTLEEQLADPRLRQARVWELEMSGVDRLDLPCAYALLRAVTTLPAPVALRIHGARRALQRTLRGAGLDAVATFDSSRQRAGGGTG